MALVDRLQPSMLRVARMYVSTAAVAEEVVQETWLGVLRGLDSFQGRSSLRTWIFRILTNIAKTRGQREGRSLPFASLAGDDLDAARRRSRIVSTPPDPRLAGRGRRCPTTGRGSRRIGSSAARRWRSSAGRSTGSLRCRPR